MRPALKFPEADFVGLSFLFHFVWEFAQIPWYAGMAELPHLEGVLLCARASIGDALIALTAYLGVVGLTRDRYWPERLTGGRIAAFLVIGLTITLIAEWLATEVYHRWSYTQDMPRLPIIGTGLAPILQWILIPSFVLVFVRRIWRV